MPDGMNFFKGMDIAASAMTAQKYSMDIISENIANADTTMDPETGKLYQQKIALLRPDEANNFMAASFGDELNQAIGGGVKTEGFTTSNADARKIYDPGNPLADEKGYIYKPNVNVIDEMTTMMTAKRMYDAAASAIEAQKQMAMKSLDIMKGM